MQRLFTEVKRLALNPLEAVTSSVETSTEWVHSRRWLRVLPFLPIGITVLSLYIYAWVQETAGEQDRVRGYIEHMDAEFPISQLETILYRDVLLLNGEPLDKDYEVDINETANNSIGARNKAPLVSELKLPSKEVLDQFKFAIDRIEQFSSNNSEITYRRAVLDALTGNLENANAEIAKLVNGTATQLPAANHWHAVNLLNKKFSGESISEPELNRVLTTANEWRMARPAIQMIQAVQLLRQNRIDPGLDLMLTASEKIPEQLVAVAELAKQNKRDRVFQTSISKAEKFFRAKLDTAMEKPSDRINFVNTQLLQDRKQVAVEILNAAIKDAAVPQPELKQKLSDIYLAEFVKIQGDAIDSIRPEALSMLQKAVDADELNPNLGNTIAVLVASGRYSGTEIPKSFYSVLQKQIVANRVSPTTLMMIGGMYYRQGKFNLAETAWQKALEATPTSVEALNNLAMIEFDKNQPNKELALERIQKAYEIAPGGIEVCDSYGQVLLKLGRPNEAIPFFEKALRLSPERDSTRKMLAKCYADIGQDKISAAYQALVSVPADSEPPEQQSVEPSEAEKSTDATSAEAKPAEAKPAEAKPAEAKPAEAKPAEAKPAEAKPAEAKPAEATSTGAKPAEAKPEK